MNFRTTAVGVALLLAAVYWVGTSVQATDEDFHFRTKLSGNEEVPVRATAASGSADLRWNVDQTELRFRLSVSHIRNVVAAHIHCGTPGVNGPVGLTLYGPVPPGGGKISGVIARGVATAPDAGNGCSWADLAAVTGAIEGGRAYVNVHTNDGVDPANAGPGDFPGGEIRGHPIVRMDDDEGPEFVAKLSGSNEVPARDTAARGKAHIQVSEDGTTLLYRITARDISNVFMAHIHCGAEGANGPVGVTLYGVGPTAQGPRSGLLVLAMKRAPDTGNACGWETIGDVVAAMEGGDTYVNVHTNDGVDPPNSGPGDFPGGEIRGQLHLDDD